MVHIKIGRFFYILYIHIIDILYLIRVIILIFCIIYVTFVPNWTSPTITHTVIPIFFSHNYPGHKKRIIQKKWYLFMFLPPAMLSCLLLWITCELIAYTDQCLLNNHYYHDNVLAKQMECSLYVIFAYSKSTVVFDSAFWLSWMSFVVRLYFINNKKNDIHI